MSMIYELRVYQAAPGRMQELLDRFENITIPLWRRHGIETAGFWTTVIGPSNQRLYYFLKWESLADREAKWAAFQSDQEWIAKRAETERNGPLVANVANELLQPTRFSSVK
jgi:hypothetical protein